MPRTPEDIEKALDELLARKTIDPKELADIREEIVKLQQLISKSPEPPAVKQIIKKKIKRLKAKPWFDFLAQDEFEEIDDPNDTGEQNNG